MCALPRIYFPLNRQNFEYIRVVFKDKDDFWVYSCCLWFPCGRFHVFHLLLLLLLPLALWNNMIYQDYFKVCFYKVNVKRIQTSWWKLHEVYILRATEIPSRRFYLWTYFSIVCFFLRVYHFLINTGTQKYL